VLIVFKIIYAFIVVNLATPVMRVPSALPVSALPPPALPTLPLNPSPFGAKLMVHSSFRRATLLLNSFRHLSHPFVAPPSHHSIGTLHLILRI
jgi:hypothetical protein